MFYDSRKWLDRSDHVRFRKLRPVSAGDPCEQRCPPGKLSDKQKRLIEQRVSDEAVTSCSSNGNARR